jgi:hypothetical protein
MEVPIYNLLVVRVKTESARIGKDVVHLLHTASESLLENWRWFTKMKATSTKTHQFPPGMYPTGMCSHAHPETCVGQLHLAVIKCLRESIEMEERFIFVHSFRGFNPWSIGPHCFRACGKAVHRGRSVGQR